MLNKCIAGSLHRQMCITVSIFSSKGTKHEDYNIYIFVQSNPLSSQLSVLYVSQKYTSL